MRTLWSFVVVCLVAVSGGGGGGVRALPSASALDRTAALTARAVATRPALQPRSGATRAPQLSLPPAVLARSSSLPVPPSVAIEAASLAPARVLTALLLTRSARGPPLA